MATLEYAIAPPPGGPFRSLAVLWSLGFTAVVFALAPIYVWMDEMRRQSMNPNAYPMEWFERQPEWICGLCVLGWLARLPILISALIAATIQDRRPLMLLAIALAASQVLMYAFDCSVSFWYHAL